MIFSERRESLWMGTTPLTHFPVMAGDVKVDVAVVGGGITGITAATLLKRQGLTVAIVELGRIGLGETGHTTAHLTQVVDGRYSKLIAHFGLEKARMVAESNKRAIDLIESLVQSQNISCGFQRVPGFLYAETEEYADALHDECAACEQAGLPVRLANQSPLPFSVHAALRFENQAQFHPRRYLLPLANALIDGKNHVFELTRMLEVEDGDTCRVHTNHGTITARHVIVAANVPSLNRFFLITKLAAYRTYAIAARMEENQDLNGLFWDMDEPYHYIRSHRTAEGNFLIVGGEDHKTGQMENTDGCYDRLEEFARGKFRISNIEYKWSGQVIDSVDKLPYIGLNSSSRNVYVATGFMGNGMTFGTVAGMLLADQITGRSNPWKELYHATRVKPFAGARQFIAENVDYPSCLVADRLSSAEGEDLSDVRPDEGKIIRVDGQKIAAYRDEVGRIHMMSPVCPHLGCHVNWNDAEKSWDCPCHGSRFDCTGKLMNGPAIGDLKSLDERPMGGETLTPVQDQRHPERWVPLHRSPEDGMLTT